MGYENLYDIETLYLNEYTLKMKAFRLSRVDRMNDMHMQAWLNHAVTATKEQGKNQVPVYKTYKEFFDYEKQISEIQQPKSKKLSEKMRRSARAAAELNKRG